jgi:cystathionine gamma-synthase
MVGPDEVAAETWAVVGGRPQGAGAPLNTPIVPAAPFELGGERIYSRNEATESWEALEALIGGLEGGHAVAFASGLAACAAVLADVGDGAHVVLGDDVYLGVAGQIGAGARDHGWRVERLALGDPAWVDRVREADLLWLESPSNPLLDVADLAAIGAAPRRPGTTLVVDNTFATPLLQRPLALGFDVVVHSATKFIGGHSDLLLGLAVTADPARAERLRAARGLYGATPGALECFLALRGARTLPLRLERASATAAALAARLGDHPAVARVRYPGLGAVVSFELADAAAADRACAAVRLVRHATSLGGVETTMERRGTHAGQEHIPPGLIRLSTGLEDPADVWRDLERALAA